MQKAELYDCEIRDSFGYVVSASLVLTPAEVAKWYMEHGIRLDSVTIRMSSHPNVIASYTAKEQD